MLSGSPISPLPAIANGCEVRSGYPTFGDSVSSVGKEPFADMDAPWPLVEALDGFARRVAEVDEVKPLTMNPLDDFAPDPGGGGGGDAAASAVRLRTQSAVTCRSPDLEPVRAVLPPVSSGSLYGVGGPAFAEYTGRASRRGLLAYFDNVLSRLIVFKEDDGGNPFRQMVLPMAQKSPSLLHTVYAVASAHLENRGVQVEERALDLHTRALQGLANLITCKDEETRDEVLAVIVLLLYYEVSGVRRRPGRNRQPLTRRLGGEKRILDRAQQPPTRRAVHHAGTADEADRHEPFSRKSKRNPHLERHLSSLANARGLGRRFAILTWFRLCHSGCHPCPAPSWSHHARTSSPGTTAPPWPR